MQIRKEEFLALQNSDGFKFYKFFLFKLKEDVKEAWGQGYFVQESAESTNLLTSRQLGKVELLDWLLSEDRTYEDIVRYLSNDE